MDPVCILLTGLIILCDWVASSGPFDRNSIVDENYQAASMEIAENTLEKYGLIGSRANLAVGMFSSVWPQIQTPRDIQRKCEQINPDAPLTIIEAPMGEGKTEAALYLAERMCSVWNKRGIYIALPTQATSNQMYGRTNAMLDTIHSGHARLLHGTAFLQDEERRVQSDDAQEAERWLGSLRMGMLDENGVGTVDQAMAGVLRARFSVLRLLGLENKVLVIDELHAYDAYMSKIIQSLLRWCKGLRIPVILLSATLQESQRKEYISCFTEQVPGLSSAYPLITQVNEAGEMTQTEAAATLETTYSFVPVRLGQNEKLIAQYAVDHIKHGGCYCVLVNTVGKAQNVYRALLEIVAPETKMMLFHARFPIGRREEIEKECLTCFGKGAGAVRPEKAIIVATQVKRTPKEFDQLRACAKDKPITADIALFGRMVTSDYFADVDAAMQVAHAISTHAVNRESDYFTAVDDLLGQSDDSTGAGMIGDVDYCSCCYYEYAALDTDILRENLKNCPDREALMEKLVPVLLRAMAYTNPSGKQNTFAGQVLPDLVMVECKKDKIPLSYVNAFEEPVSAWGNQPNLVKKSIEKLTAHVDCMDHAYELPVLHRAFFAPRFAETQPKACDVYDQFTALAKACAGWLQEDDIP